MNAVKPDRRTAKRAAGMLLCLLALFAAVPQAGAVNPGARYFTHLKTTDSGLSYNCVHAIIQDSRGFIWLGTSDGLNRYDGMRFRTFHKNELGGNSGFIVSLCEDDRGDIWIGTDSGVVLYDAATDRFRALDTPSDRGTVIHNKVTTIKKDRQGVIWMAVNNQGLFSCDPESGALKNYFVEEGRQTLPANITSFCFDVNNECWLSLYFSNLYHADKALTEATPVEFGDRGQLFRNDNIIEIIESPYNTLYVASVDKGVCEIAPRSSKIRTLIPNAENRYVPESLFSGRDGELWAATTKGIYVYNPGSGETIRLKADRQDKFSLSDSHTLSVLVDDSDGIWIGTNAGGVNYSGAFHQNFDKYHIVGDEPLANCLVRGFADDGEGRLWITTEKSGLMTYSLKTKELRKYRNKQLPEALFGIGHDDGKLWLGSFQGLYRLDLKTGTVKVYSRRDESSSLHDNKIYTIYKTSEGDLLVGTTLGMLRYDRAGDSFTPVPVFEGMFITDIAEDISGDLWVATYANGLIRYDPAAGAIVRSYTYAADNPRSLPSNKVLSVFRDSADRIWATTFSAGFCLYDGQNDDFVVYDQALLGAGNLPSDINYRIVEDDSGNLWISTNKGLICFTPATLETKAYTTTDGLLNDEFNYNAGFKTSDGTLYFGSSDGFVRFNPRTFHTDTRVPEIVITDLRIGERIVKAGEEGSPLACNIDRTQHIALNARQNSFGFGFALLGFASPASNTILCRLEGYDTHWRKVPESNRIFYSNIPAGSYRLQVKGVNSNGIWNDRHPAVEITVAQRFYKSTPAILLYVLLLIFASILVSHYFYRKAVKRERQRQNEYKRAREIELFNEKMAFFSNIVHEIKTPLTLIRTPLQNILASGECGGEVREDLMVINNNTEYLSQLVKELLDFVKIECHGYMLNCGNLDLIEKIGFLCFNFAETAKSNNLRLTFRHEEEQLSILADEPGLNKILNNLLHNALKYAESYIEVEARSEGGNAVVSIRNDGPIIPKEHRSRIFEPFVQYGRRQRRRHRAFAGPHPRRTARRIARPQRRHGVHRLHPHAAPAPHRGGARRRGGGDGRTRRRSGEAGTSDAAHRGGQRRSLGLPETQAARRIPHTHRRVHRTGAGTAPPAGGGPRPLGHRPERHERTGTLQAYLRGFRDLAHSGDPPLGALLDAVESRGHGVRREPLHRKAVQHGVSPSLHPEHPRQAERHEERLQEQGHAPRSAPLQPAAQRRGVPLAARRDHPGQHQRPQLLERTARRSILSEQIDAQPQDQGTARHHAQRLYPHQTARRGRADADRKPLPHQ